MLERLRLRLAWWRWYLEVPPILNPGVRRCLSASPAERLRALPRLNDRWLDREPRLEVSPAPPGDSALGMAGPKVQRLRLVSVDAPGRRVAEQDSQLSLMAIGRHGVGWMIIAWLAAALVLWTAVLGRLWSAPCTLVVAQKGQRMEFPPQRVHSK